MKCLKVKLFFARKVLCKSQVGIKDETFRMGEMFMKALAKEQTF